MTNPPDCALLVENARLITLAPDRPAVFSGWMAVDGEGRIIATGEGRATMKAAEVIDARGCFVAPGFISGHSHIFTSGSRGMGADCSLYPWIEANTIYTRECGPEDIYWCTLHGSLDFLGNGITTAYDFTDSRQPFRMIEGRFEPHGPFKPIEYVHEQTRAKVDAGLRHINSVLINDQYGSDAEIIDRFGEYIAYADGLGRPDLTLAHAVTGSVQWSDDPRTAEREVAIMRRYGIINQPHFVESPEHLEYQQAKFAWYEAAGALGPDLVFGHFIHATEEMKCKCAACNVAMIWQPMSNGRLASGVADIPGIIGKGMRVGVGVDDQSCTDISDPWQNMRTGIYMQRAAARTPAAMGVGQMLRLHTLGTAEALGIADRVGSLEPGKFADFLLVDPTAPDIGPLWDPIASYVLAIGLRNLKAVYVGGRCVSREGISTHPQAMQASAELHGRLGRIAEQVAAQS